MRERRVLALYVQGLLVIYPRCANCGRGRGKHRKLEPGVELCPAYGGNPEGWTFYAPKRPKRTVRASVPSRKSAPKRKARPRKQRKTGRAALQRLADKLCGAIVRARGACEGDIHGKGGPLQWAHGFSRRYHATRWLPINGFCLCAGCHFYYGSRPLEWWEFMVKALGQPVYDELRRIALANEKQDMAAVVAKLREEAEKRGIQA